MQRLFVRRVNASAFVLSSGLLVAFAAGCQHSHAPDVVATVNGKEILGSDLEKYYKNSLGDSPQQPSTEEAEIRKLTVLHSMIEEEILQQRAAKLNLTASDEDVNIKLTEIKAPFNTQDEFDKQLKQRNLTIDDFRRDLRNKLTETKLINKEIEAKINVTDAEISNYYNAHKSEYNLIEPQYHLAQIVVTGAPSQQPGNLQNNKASGDADAKRKIEALLGKLQSGEDFGAVAQSFSENPNNAPSGGDMGFVAESALHSDPQAYNAINKLKPGQISEILPIYDGPGLGHRTVGYAIYKLYSREPAGQRDLKDPRVSQTISKELREAREQLLKNAYLEKLHDEAKVQNYLADQILKRAGQ